MTPECVRIAELLERSPAERAEPPAELRSHLDRCPHCRRLWQFLVETEPAEVSPGAQERIAERLTASLRPVRPLAKRRVIAFELLAVFLAASAVSVWAIGWGAAERMTMLQLLGLSAAALVAAAVAGTWLSAAMAPGERRWTGSGGLCAGSLAALALLVAALFPWEAQDGRFGIGYRCFRAGLLVSLPVVVPLALVLRRGFPASWGSVGAGVGLLAGLVGFLMLHLGCSLHSARHILGSHLAAPLAGAAVGYAIGKAFETLQRSRAAQT